MKFLNVWHVLLLIVCLGAFAVTLPSFGPGYVASWDDPGHIARAGHFISSLNPTQLGIYGVFYGWYLGTSIFTFYPPGMYMFLAAMKFATFGLLPVSFLLHVLMALVFATFPLLIYWLSRTLGLSQKASLVAGIISTSLSGIWAIGLAGIYAIGLYTNVFSLIPLTIFWIFLHRTFCRNNFSDLILAGIMLGCTIITSIFAFFFSIILLMAYNISFFITSGKTKRKEMIVLIALGFFISLFWTVAFIDSVKLFGPETGFASLTLTELLSDTIRGNIIMHEAVALLMFFGFIVCVWLFYKKRQIVPLVLAILLVFTLVAASSNISKIINSWQFSWFPALKIMQRALRLPFSMRILSFLWIIVPVVSAVGFEFIMQKIERIRSAKLISFVIFIALFIFIMSHTAEIARQTVKTTGGDEYGGRYAEWAKSFAWLKKNAPPQSVVYTSINWNDFHPIGALSFESMLNVEANMNAVRGNHLEASILSLHPLENANLSTREGGENLHKYGVDYILAYRTPEYNSSYLEKVYGTENITIYATKDLPGPYQPVDLQKGTNSFRLVVNVTSPGEIELPLQYNNHWKAEVNGVPQEVVRSQLGLSALNLGAGINNLELKFKPTFLEYLAFIPSVATLIASLIYLFSARFRGAVNILAKTKMANKHR